MANDLAEVAARFGAELRRAGLPVGPGRSERFANAVIIASPHTPDELYRCALATLVSDKDETDVLSPLLGVYYRAPKPGEPPFVEVGQSVEETSIIGIVEVMKLMNSVRAGVSGTVVAIHAPNAEMVEFEQPLIRIRTSG